MSRVAATSSTGFFQTAPALPNAYEDDIALQRSARLFLASRTLSSIEPELTQLGTDVLSPRILSAIVDAEVNQPYLRGGGYDAFGRPNGADALVVGWGWNTLQDFGLSQGFVAGGYDSKLAGSARVVEALKLHIWSPSSAMVVCPSGMQDGAISVLLKERERQAGGGAKDARMKGLEAANKTVIDSALSRLLSRDPSRAWTSGQWMTERAGGSDVRGTQTIADWVGTPSVSGSQSQTDIDGNPLGPWSISGFKFFSSATDCGCAVVLAYTPKGLSCFFAPTRKVVNGAVEMNGIKIQRLKNKLGTKALPTAELELKDMRAWLLGEEGRGVAVIATVLNVTRFHNMVRGCGMLSRGLSVVRAFARVRAFPSRLPPNNYLRSIPLFNKTLAKVTLRYRGDVLLAGFVASLLGAANSGSSANDLVPRDHAHVDLLLRLLTSVAKAYNTKHGIIGMQECMEALGGVGYLENNESPALNLARVFRDSNVMSIWEGTTDVLSTDTVKVLRGRQGAQATHAMDHWIRKTLGGVNTHAAPGARLPSERIMIAKAWQSILDLPKDIDAVMPYARDIMERIGNITAATLLIKDAERDGDATAAEVASRFAWTYLAEFATTERPKRDWREETHWDQRIAFDGDEIGSFLPAKL